MRVVVLGGTRFIGRAVVEELAARGHELLIVHRGTSEPEGLPAARHLHVERRALPEARPELLAFSPEAAIDTFALTAEDADAALAVLPDDIPTVVLSSSDVYRAYTALREGRQTEPVPIDEEAPLREDRYPYRGEQLPGVDADRYEKLDVEPRYLARGGTVLRLGIVYGEHDWQAREDFVLRRLRHGRDRIPVGTGTLLLSRVWVRDVARAAAAALERPHAAGEVINVAERRTLPVRAWIEQIMNAAGAEAELVSVPDQALPPDLALTGASQHLLLDAAKARELLGFEDTDPETAVPRSVAWHLEHPPADDSDDFSLDDRALGG